MNLQQLDEISAWFDGFVASFRSDSADGQRNYDLKIEHTAKVRNNIELLADSLDLPADKRALASVIAICHDVGRFPQYKRYGTFNDATSANHAALAVQTLKSEGILEILDAQSRDLVLQSVALHNLFLLPHNLHPETLLFARLIRDADKLDIWRVLIEYCTAPKEERASAVIWELPDTGLCTEAALAEVLLGQFGLAAPEGHLDEDGFLLADVLLVVPDSVDCQGDIGHRGTFGGVAQLGIPGEIADEHDFVEIGHNGEKLQGLIGGRRRETPLVGAASRLKRRVGNAASGLCR